MTEDVAEAIDQIKCAYPDHKVVVRGDAEGGAFVIVEGVPLGHPYSQATTWIGFHITFQYPEADVYPHFVAGDLARQDGRQLGEATATGQTFEQRPAVQLSRKSNRLNPLTDTALLKMEKVLSWLRVRP